MGGEIPPSALRGGGGARHRRHERGAVEVIEQFNAHHLAGGVEGGKHVDLALALPDDGEDGTPQDLHELAVHGPQHGGSL